MRFANGFQHELLLEEFMPRIEQRICNNSERGVRHRNQYGKIWSNLPDFNLSGCMSRSWLYPRNHRGQLVDL